MRGGGIFFIKQPVRESPCCCEQYLLQRHESKEVERSVETVTAAATDLAMAGLVEGEVVAAVEEVIERVKQSVGRRGGGGKDRFLLGCKIQIKFGIFFKRVRKLKYKKPIGGGVLCVLQQCDHAKKFDVKNQFPSSRFLSVSFLESIPSQYIDSGSDAHCGWR